MENETEKSRRATAKQKWNDAHYTQVKVSVDKKIATAFKKACMESFVSMANVLATFMVSFAQGDIKTKNTYSPNEIVSLATKRQRRNRAKYHIEGLELIKAAEEASRDNIPENLQNSVVFDNAENTISLLDEAIDLIVSAFE
jgi:hypothetical protein